MSDKEEGTRSDAGKGRSLRTMVQEKEGLQRPYLESTGKLVKYLRMEHHDLTSDQKLSQAGEMVQQVEILYRERAEYRLKLWYCDFYICDSVL